MSMRQAAMASARWTILSTLIRTAIALLQVIILARILSPEDFGLQALAMTVITTTILVSDMGLSSAIIRDRDITADELSSLYWLNILVGACLTGLLLLATGAIAGFYGDPRLAELIQVLAWIFVLTSSTQQFKALYEKELQFRTPAIIEIASASVGFVTAVVLAQTGHAVLSLTYGFVALSVTSTCLYWLMIPKSFRPSLHFNFSEIIRFVKFGSHLVGTSLANSLGSQADIIVSGRLFAPAVVGLYFQPRDLVFKVMMAINPIVTRIGLPLIAKVQHDRAAVGRVYTQTILMTASVNFPIYALFATFPYETVSIVLGEQWHSASELLRAIAIWCAFRSIGNPIGSLLIGTGRARRALISSLVVTVCLYAVSWFAGTTWGALGVPYSMAAFYAILIPVFWFAHVRPIANLGARAYHTALLWPCLASLCAVGAGWLAALPFETSLLRLAAGGIVGGAVYLAASYVLNRSWLISMTHLLRHRG